MNISLVLLDLAGAVALLLFSVRMVRTGVERSQEPALRRFLRDGRGSRLRAAAIGIGAAVLLQSSTAVAVLVGGFAGSGALTVATGLAIMVGADLGSALVVQLLSIDLQWLAPLLLVVGSVLFMRAGQRNFRQLGRVLIGIALILVSLRMLGAATQPLRESAALPVAVAYLRGDFVSAFVLGALFTWGLHSSIAAVLLIAAFAGQGIVPAELGVSLLLGANLGGGLIAAGLLRSASVEARRITLGNLGVRGSLAVAALLAFHALDPGLSAWGSDASRQLVNLHLAFNAVLLIVALPLIDPVVGLATRLVVPRPSPEQQGDPLAGAASCLDRGVIGEPALALASATRELLRMAEIIERMLAPLMELYETGDREKIRQARRLETAVDQAQSDIKLYLASIRYPDADDAAVRRGQELSSFAINLEHVGDAVAGTLLPLAEVRRDKGLAFSPEGWRELSDLHQSVMANMALALNVLVSADSASARQLVVEKDNMRTAVRASYSRHLTRLQQGVAASVATSDLHLETIRTLKSINSLFASVAHPILAETGDLLDSRLRGRSA